MRIGIVGDFHHPERSRIIPEWIWERLSHCSAMISGGDFTSQSVVDRLSSIAPLIAVRGNMDFLPLPLERKVEMEGWRIGICHGSDIHPRGDFRQLYDLAHSMDVDIFVHGHTHMLDIRVFKGLLFLNPGSACGVWSGGGIRPRPTLILCDIGEKIVAEGIEDNLAIRRVEFKKK